jgi:STIP1 family protein 1
MAGPDPTVNAARALAFKEQGNKCFQAGEFKQAEQLYTNAFVPFSFPISHN